MQLCGMIHLATIAILSLFKNFNAWIASVINKRSNIYPLSVTYKEEKTHSKNAKRLCAEKMTTMEIEWKERTTTTTMDSICCIWFDRRKIAQTVINNGSWQQKCNLAVHDVVKLLLVVVVVIRQTIVIIVDVAVAVDNMQLWMRHECQEFVFICRTDYICELLCVFVWMDFCGGS